MPSPSLPDTPWRITYRDGSNNQYRFHKASEQEPASFTYSPITPETSSSGVYSGGAPQQGTLDDAQAEALWQWIHTLEAETSAHLTTRPMGSGRFYLTTPNGTRTFTMSNGRLLRDFNAWLASFKAMRCIFGF